MLLDKVLALLWLVSVKCWGVILHIPSILCTETRDQQQLKLEGAFKPTDPQFIYNIFCFNNSVKVQQC